MPRISLITVAYNAAATIADTMDSVAAQDFDDFEHLVIDGASTDSTADIARARGTTRTRIASEADNGLYDAMNKGLAMARGDYIGFLNADDFFVRKDALSLIAAAAANGAPAVSGAVVIVSHSYPHRWVRSYSSTHFRPWMLRFGHMPPHPGFYARSDVAEVVGNFNTSLSISSDFDWILRFHQYGYFAHAIGNTLVAVREGGLSNRGYASRERIAREAFQSLKACGVKTHPILLWVKYCAKVVQYLIPPNGYPAPDTVRLISRP